jgi:hypothetical protein
VIDHADQDVGLALLMHAIGTTDLDFLHGLISQLVAVNDDHGEADYGRLNWMLSVIKGLKPRDQLEAMLGAQMAAVHVSAMVVARRLIASENIIHQDSMEGALNRLTRTFTTQMECLKRYRASGPRGAKTRPGRACNSPAVRGKRRCRMHGGAPGSGARAATRTR